MNIPITLLNKTTTFMYPIRTKKKEKDILKVLKN